VYADVALADLRPFIDWTPFFHTWRLKGSYPGILERDDVGAEARRLLDDAESAFEEMAAAGLTARGAAGLFPAASAGDDVEVYEPGSEETVVARLHFLRKQRSETRDGSCPSLADLVAPRTSGHRDWIGAFAVSTGFGVDALADRHAEAGDDYRAILIKALADRLAEAFAERLHQLVRTDLWGYAPDEDLDNEALIRESYRGIRPAPGYPACPDHEEKRALFALLDAPARLGLELTETGMVVPAASVCGWYFSHPNSRYFGVGKLGLDQVTDYAARRGESSAECERRLAPYLAYEATVERSRCT
jgi:5-methyltetrahydrofolate--homocysteine methyltransferase